MLSNTVGKAMQLMKIQEPEKTIEFIFMFDKLFDCLNVSSLSAGKHSRNALKVPHHSASDFRINPLAAVSIIIYTNTHRHN